MRWSTNSMDSKFDANESLVRAVYPENQRPDFWENGRLSSAALKDKKGLSVTRTCDRSLKDTVEWMTLNFKGAMVAITVRACTTVQAYVKYCPSQNNPYHSEIHGSEEVIELNDYQALYLARQATLEFRPNFKLAI